MPIFVFQFLTSNDVYIDYQKAIPMINNRYRDFKLPLTDHVR